MKASRTINEVQQLTRRVTALSQFLSKVMKKCLPFFKVLKKAYEWNNKCNQAFKELKKIFGQPVTIEVARARCYVIDLPISFSLGCLDCPLKGRDQYPKTDLLYKQSLQGMLAFSWYQLPSDYNPTFKPTRLESLIRLLCKRYYKIQVHQEDW